MEQRTSLAQVQLGPGVMVWVETADVAARGVDAVDPIPTDLVQTIEDVGRALMVAAQALAPQKFSVEFGVEVGGEAGIPFVTKGTAKASFTVSLEWSSSKAG
jgi:Trypsin-co-occurring domain 1